MSLSVLHHTIARSTRTPSAPATAVPDELLDVVRRALSACEERDLGTLDAAGPAGRALVALSALARSAARAAGIETAASVTSGPGVVVVRDLVAAAQLLEAAIGRSTTAPTPAERAAQVTTAHELLAQLLASTRSVSDLPGNGAAGPTGL